MISTNTIIILVLASLTFVGVIAGSMYALYRLYRYLERKNSK